MLTIAYIRVSTEEQLDHSPEAQRKRCLQHALSLNLGEVKFLCDEGVSGKTLDRPAMRDLIALVEADEVASVVVWRLDRLTRDSGDLSRLIRLFETHCVSVHSVNEGAVQVGTAAGRMQAGMHGVIRAVLPRARRRERKDGQYGGHQQRPMAQSPAHWLRLDQRRAAAKRNVFVDWPRVRAAVGRDVVHGDRALDWNQVLERLGRSAATACISG